MHDWKVHDCNKSARLSLHNQGLILALITLHTFHIPFTLSARESSGIRIWLIFLHFDWKGLSSRWQSFMYIQIFDEFLQNVAMFWLTLTSLQNSKHLFLNSCLITEQKLLQFVHLGHK